MYYIEELVEPIQDFKPGASNLCVSDLKKRLSRKKMRNILSDSSKVTHVSIAECKQLNFIVNNGKHTTDLLKDLKNSEAISEIVKLILKVSNQEVLGLECFTVFVQLITSSFRLILSAIKTSTYNLPKFFVPFLEPIATNMYTVKNSFKFAK